MRHIFTTREALTRGVTMSALKCGERARRWRRIIHGAYGQGPEDPTELDRAIARVLVRDGAAARDRLAGVLHGLDEVTLDARLCRRRPLPSDRIVRVHGVPCADGVQTLMDLAATLDDLVWEQALESALRKKLASVAALEAHLPELGRARAPGTARLRRVLRLRPPGAAPTESLLETLMVQLARTVPALGDPERQHKVRDAHDQFVARIDLAWPGSGFFIELDGEHHKDQPVYDSRRETAIVAATGWLPGRFTWTEVRHHPRSTARRLAAIAEQATRRLRGA